MVTALLEDLIVHVAVELEFGLLSSCLSVFIVTKHFFIVLLLRNLHLVTNEAKLVASSFR